MPSKHVESEMLRNIRKARIEWPSTRCQYFLPADKFENFLQPHNVLIELRRMFSKMSNSELEKICSLIFHPENPARKLFAIHIYGYSSNDKIILDLLAEGVADRDLPFIRIDKHTIGENEYESNFTLGRKSHTNCALKDHNGCGIKTLEDWDTFDIEALYQHQWLVLAPVFEASTNGTIPHIDLEASCLLPFVKDDDEDRLCGGYSTVRKVTIHHAHHNFLNAQRNKASRFAVKIPFSSEKDLIHRERSMLSDVTFCNHKHLVKLLATWNRNNKYHMLFICAKSNLRAFWNSVNPEHNFPTWIWAIEQMKGLASALKAIHIFDTTTLPQNAYRAKGSQDDQQQTSRTGALLKVASAEAKFGRHGDLKPENILLLDNPSSENYFGDLQISDFGLSRFHRFESRSKVDPRAITGSATYLPPELYLETPVSRAYDIWSLGCVYLEFVTWILEGSSGGKLFADSRAETGLDPRVKDDQFYTELSVNGIKQAIIRQGVNSWIAYLRGSLMCSPMIIDLLDLIQDGMLLIATQERINASGLDERLGYILQKAQDTKLNPQYCVVGSNSLSHPH